MSKIFPITNREIVLANISECRQIEDEFYNDAFFDIKLNKLKAELR